MCLPYSQTFKIGHIFAPAARPPVACVQTSPLPQEKSGGEATYPPPPRPRGYICCLFTIYSGLLTLLLRCRLYGGLAEPGKASTWTTHVHQGTQLYHNVTHHLKVCSTVVFTYFLDGCETRKVNRRHIKQLGRPACPAIRERHLMAGQCPQL